MRIMAASACKHDASKTLLIQQANPEKPRACGGFDLGNCARKLHAIQALNCVTIVILDSAGNRKDCHGIRQWRRAPPASMNHPTRSA
jgi:hypothetical protein